MEIKTGAHSLLTVAVTVGVVALELTGYGHVLDFVDLLMGVAGASAWGHIKKLAQMSADASQKDKDDLQGGP